MCQTPSLSKTRSCRVHSQSNSLPFVFALVALEVVSLSPKANSRGGVKPFARSKIRFTRTSNCGSVVFEIRVQENDTFNSFSDNKFCFPQRFWDCRRGVKLMINHHYLRYSRVVLSSSSTCLWSLVGMTECIELCHLGLIRRFIESRIRSDKASGRSISPFSLSQTRRSRPGFRTLCLRLSGSVTRAFPRSLPAEKPFAKKWSL